jgi:hypothetical protein
MSTSATAHIPFWITSPHILFDHKYWTELIPKKTMTATQKTNAVVRGMFAFFTIMTLVTLNITYSIVGVWVIAAFSILAMIMCAKTKYVQTEGFANATKKKIITKNNNNLNNMNNMNKTKHKSGKRKDSVSLDETNIHGFISSNFQSGSAANPFANPLLTDIVDDPTRLAAPPAFDPTVRDNIDRNVKHAVQSMNPTVNNTNKQIFGDHAEVFKLYTANRQFHSVANSRIANDQGSFGQYLYGDMPSGKESGARAAIAREHSSQRHTLR